MSEQAWAQRPGQAGLSRLALAAGSRPYVATVFLSAALVFLVQPMFAKMATPLLGGSPSVWNVSLVCFQAALLAGYLYAHALTRFVTRLRTQVIIHALALVLGALVLPMALTQALGPPDPHAPTLWLVGVFALSIAPPFAVMSATAPLIQAWYARSGRSDAADPYHLYAASNIGSILGLALYPLVIEPLSALADQTIGWAFGYGILALLLMSSGLSAVLTGGDRGTIARNTARERAPVRWTQRLTWVALAFVPSSLLVGATTHIATDVASAPFLWAPPLMVYLLSFIVVFAKRPMISLPVASRLLPLGVAAAFLSLPAVTSFPIALDFFIQLTALFLASVVCHGVLVAKRPDAEHLTEFYLLMSLGGVLGGAFNALLVPVIFEVVLEYPLVLALSLLARPAGEGLGGQRGRVLLLMAGACVAGAILIRMLAPESDPVLFDRILLAIAVLCIVLTRVSRVAPFVAAACAWSVGQVSNPIGGGLTERGFFGVVRVAEAAGARTMMHGTTLHGAQLLAPEKRLVPTTYYAPATPIGQAFAAYQGQGAVGVVGLGVGSVACYRQPGQSYVFYEIDPIVARLASDPSQFTYLSDCAPDAPIVLGDGRLTLAEEPEGRFDLLLIDAFSSDSVPAHLITREAVALYISRLSEEGILVMHVSNRHLALEAILARIAHAEGVPAYYTFFVPEVSEDAEAQGVSPYEANASQVVVMARNEAALARYATDAEWTRLETDGSRAWTDDYSNVIGAMFDKVSRKH
jgi:hypothetical protein